MRTKKFQRVDVNKYSKLGLRRKNKIKYRKGKGEGNKIRLKMKGHLRNISIGFRSPRKTRGLIEGLRPVLIHNVKELMQIKAGEIAIVAKIGDKKRKEIAETALKHKIKLQNLNIPKFLKNLEFKLKKSKEERQHNRSKKSERDKKARKEVEKKEKETPKEEVKEEKTNSEVKSEESKKIRETKKEVQTNNYGRGK